jgi:hypothetical protein
VTFDEAVDCDGMVVAVQLFVGERVVGRVVSVNPVIGIELLTKTEGRRWVDLDTVTSHRVVAA